jgi:hypothetical protein
VLKLPPLPVRGQIILYVDEDRDLHLAKVLNVYMDDFLKDCPPGTRWEKEGDRNFIHFPEDAAGKPVNLPRGFMVDLVAFFCGNWVDFERIPYNPINTPQATIEDSLGPKSWVFK